MKVCIVGGGNIGTAMAVEFAHNGHDINVLTSRPKDWNRTLTAVDADGHELFDGEISLATSDVKAAFADVDYVVVTLPPNVQAAFAKSAAPFVRDGMKFVMNPGFGGSEFLLRPIIDMGGVLVGFQRVHAIARVQEYGRKVWFDKKKSVQLAALSSDELGSIANDLETLFDMPFEMLTNYLCITLTPSNPVLHTSRLYTMFRSFERPLKDNPLFYADWTDEASTILLRLDDEVQSICRALDAIDLRSVRSLKDHYESGSARALTTKLRSIKSLSKILSPMKHTPEGWEPDFDNRYFTCDFNYGLDILQQFASLLRLHAPTIDEVMSWYRNAAPSARRAVELADYGLHSNRDVYNYYGIN
ncbi:MAG: NAD/NADP octopine/nopaline dehydrogenase family protein [Selenomonadaceae bacterium]|nr:NAD/NADP octopine/nopaline dehydrogenase family protein [Selenomonadaceae bacterium]